MPKDGLVVEVKIDPDLAEIIRWLVRYKSAADEALTLVIEKGADLDLPRIRGYALQALNIGARPPAVWENSRFISDEEKPQ